MTLYVTLYTKPNSNYSTFVKREKVKKKKIGLTLPKQETLKNVKNVTKIKKRKQRFFTSLAVTVDSVCTFQLGILRQPCWSDLFRPHHDNIIINLAATSRLERLRSLWAVVVCRRHPCRHSRTEFLKRLSPEIRWIGRGRPGDASPVKTFLFFPSGKRQKSVVSDLLRTTPF